MPATTSAELLARLDALGLKTTTVEHPPLHTVEESQALRGEIPGAHTKNLFLKDKKGALFLVVAAEEAVIELRQLHNRIGASGRLSFGKPELLRAVLGVEPTAMAMPMMPYRLPLRAVSWLERPRSDRMKRTLATSQAVVSSTYSMGYRRNIFNMR